MSKALAIKLVIVNNGCNIPTYIWKDVAELFDTATWKDGLYPVIGSIFL